MPDQDPAMVWAALARAAGRRCVMSLTIDEATLDAETERQCGEIFPIIRPLLRSDEAMALDYGCGAGRFTLPLAQTVGCMTIGYDPCAELVEEAPMHDAVRYITGDPDRFIRSVHGTKWEFDVIFTAMVLGHPDMDTAAVADDLVSMLSPTGLVVVIDHMPEEPPKGRWWRYQPMDYYREIFAALDVRLDRIGAVMQLENEVTILAGRRS